jgi:hypothetical protein
MVPGGSIPTVTDPIAEVLTGATFDLQVATSGRVVVGIKRNGGTGAVWICRCELTGCVMNFATV